MDLLLEIVRQNGMGQIKKLQAKKETLPRGIEPRSPALIGFNDKRKSSPLDQGRLDDRVTARPLGWLMEHLAIFDIMTLQLTTSKMHSYLCQQPPIANLS
ncbi:hypothetical protein N7522_007330 [Penicillium canescens]|nr:hypothetical protein N7522_007330 [Penicillium canescens]KAJ6165645.1 hypothetical protein N7485_008889 [Penicillium canescens]